MTGYEFLQLAVLVILSCIFALRLRSAPRRADKREGRRDESTTYSEASAAGLMISKFGPHVRRGSNIYMPSGDGLYLKLLAERHKARSKQWQTTLTKWLSDGVTIHVLITLPTEAARAYWQPWKTAYPKNLFVYFFHRSAMPNKLAIEVRRLDAYHPIVLVNEPLPAGGSSEDVSYPGAMWIERYHPRSSIMAYNIEYVAPADIAGDPEGRFELFVSLYIRLIAEMSGVDRLGEKTEAEGKSSLASANLPHVAAASGQ